MDTVDRRQFLKQSALAAGALTVLPSFKMPFHGDEDASPTPITRKLGRTGIVLPVVSMGVMRADNPALVRAAMKAGVLHFDTAHSYQQGKNEEMIGNEFKGKTRDSYIISTKVGQDSGGTQSFLERLDLSLKRLQVDYVDVVYLHGPSSKEAVLNPEMLEALTEARKSGKARFIGVSTHSNEPDVLRAAIAGGIYDVVLTSVNFKQDHYPEVKKAIAEATAAGIGIVAMKTMAGGFLDKERTKPVNCKAALKWVLQDPNVTTCIPGVTTFDQLAENLSVNLDITLTEKEKNDLAEGETHGGLYCNGCKHCTSTCPRSLPIPELMRAFMYTYGYGSPKLGRSLVSTLHVSPQPCEGCQVCTAQCIKGFDMRGRISDVARLQSVPEEFLS